MTSENISVLLVHGHMGRRAQFDFLLPTLDEAGVEYRALCLPGHEGNVGDFAHSTAAQWQEAYDNALAEMRDRGKVLVVTHSMGGLLALDQAYRAPDEAPDGILALCLPLAVRLTLLGVRLRVASALPPSKNEDERFAAARAMCGVGGINILNSARLIPNTIALLRMIRRSRRTVRGLTLPLTVVNSLSDDIVSPRAIGLATRCGDCVNTVTLSRSTHFRFPDEEKDVICGCLLRCLEDIGK